jgi:hypothetical protein
MIGTVSPEVGRWSHGSIGPDLGKNRQISG